MAFSGRPSGGGFPLRTSDAVDVVLPSHCDLLRWRILKNCQGESMNEKPPATVEEALQGIKAVQKPILPTLPVAALADLVPTVVVLVAIVAVVVGAAVLVGKFFGGGIPFWSSPSRMR
jgi:hypothetical protein